MEKKVLVADDNEHLLWLMRDILDFLGYQMVTASDGVEALNIIKDSSVPVAMIDIRMPKMDGWGVLKEIWKNRYQTEVIFISGFGDLVEIKREAEACGAFGCISKPVKVEEIESVLQECFQMLETATEVTRLERENAVLRGLIKRFDTPPGEAKTTQPEDFVDSASVRSVMHAIRNHLAIMRGSTRILKKRVRAGTEKDRAVGSLEKGIEEISEVLSEFGRFNKRCRFGVSLADPKRLIRETIEWLRPEIPKNIKLTVRLSQKIPQIYADPSRLRQSFANIIFNAVEAMPRGGKLKVKGKVTKRQDKSGIQDLCLDFSDSGVGIPKKEFPNIYIPGYSTKEKGRGLGLAVTKRIIEDHAGEINFTSEVNKGTIFTVKLPIREGGLNGVKRKSSNR